MNKIVVFTNSQRWNQLKAEFDVDDTQWNREYNAIAEKQVLKYCINDGMAILEKLPEQFDDEEGIYLVFDRIDKGKLVQILDRWEEDEVFVLIHTSGVKKIDFGNDVIVLRGNHDTEDDHYYYPIFKLLTNIQDGDTVTAKVSRIINEFFLPEVFPEFLTEFSEPDSDIDHSSRYRILSKVNGLKDVLESFKRKYKSSKGQEEYLEYLLKLRKAFYELS